MFVLRTIIADQPWSRAVQRPFVRERGIGVVRRQIGVLLGVSIEDAEAREWLFFFERRTLDQLCGPGDLADQNESQKCFFQGSLLYDL